MRACEVLGLIILLGVMLNIHLVSAWSSNNLGFRSYANSCTYYTGLINQTYSCDSNLNTFSSAINTAGDIIAIYPISTSFAGYTINISLKVNAMDGVESGYYPKIYAWNEAGGIYQLLGSPTSTGIQNLTFTLSSSQKVKFSLVLNI